MLKPRKHYSKHLKPTERDLAVFQFVGMFGCVTKEMIYQSFWQGRKERTCLERLESLVKGGYLHCEIVNKRGATETVYWIDRKASLFFPEKTRQSFMRGKPAPSEISHFIDSAQAYLRLTRSHIVTEYRHEHELRAEGGAGIADFAVSLNGVPHYVEIDSINYSGARLAAKISEIAQTGNKILWVVKSGERLDTVRSATNGYANIKVSLLDDL